MPSRVCPPHRGSHGLTAGIPAQPCNAKAALSNQGEVNNAANNRSIIKARTA